MQLCSAKNLSIRCSMDFVGILDFDNGAVDALVLREKQTRCRFLCLREWRDSSFSLRNTSGYFDLLVKFVP
jgi:hypothetical protein